jgi:hypothetical protein
MPAMRLSILEPVDTLESIDKRVISLAMSMQAMVMHYLLGNKAPLMRFIARCTTFWSVRRGATPITSKRAHTHTEVRNHLGGGGGCVSEEYWKTSVRG